MANKKIGDGFQDLKKAADDVIRVRQLLDILGIEGDQFAVSEELRSRTFDLITLPDRFNNLFSEHGWIATEDLSTQLMNQAIDLFESKDLAEAEEFICDQFNNDYFDLHSHRLRAVWVWKNTEREKLLRLAYIDHVNQRYHASVPVVLAQIDGLTFDICGQNFFIRNHSNLDLRRGISTHESGLKVIAKKFSKYREKTRPNPISLPYRHGILHGMDLGYANRLVSTKTFFALFALRPWALMCQQYELNKQLGENVNSFPSIKTGNTLKDFVRNMVSEM